jgi:hypothetical protein
LQAVYLLFAACGPALVLFAKIALIAHNNFAAKEDMLSVIATVSAHETPSEKTKLIEPGEA